MSSPGIKDFKVTCVFSIYSWSADSFPLNYDQNGLQFIDGDQVLMDNILKYGKMTNIVFKHDNNIFFVDSNAFHGFILAIACELRKVMYSNQCQLFFVF